MRQRLTDSHRVDVKPNRGKNDFKRRSINMKINPIGLQAINNYNKQARPVKTEETQKTFADQIEISTKAKEMQANSTYANERAERVKKIKEDIDSGNYKVDAKQVAEDMLKFYKG